MTTQSWATSIVGVLAVVGVALTVRQRTVADKRAQAWTRIAWCLDHTLSRDDAEAELGWEVYATVTGSSLITRTEEAVLIAVSDRSARELAFTAAGEDDGYRTEQESA